VPVQDRQRVLRRCSCWPRPSSTPRGAKPADDALERQVGRPPGTRARSARHRGPSSPTTPPHSGVCPGPPPAALATAPRPAGAGRGGSPRPAGCRLSAASGIRAVSHRRSSCQAAGARAARPGRRSRTRARRGSRRPARASPRLSRRTGPSGPGRPGDLAASSHGRAAGEVGDLEGGTRPDVRRGWRAREGLDPAAPAWRRPLVGHVRARFSAGSLGEAVQSSGTRVRASGTARSTTSGRTRRARLAGSRSSCGVTLLKPPVQTSRSSPRSDAAAPSSGRTGSIVNERRTASRRRVLGPGCSILRIRSSVSWAEPMLGLSRKCRSRSGQRARPLLALDGGVDGGARVFRHSTSAMLSARPPPAPIGKAGPCCRRGLGGSGDFRPETASAQEPERAPGRMAPGLPGASAAQWRKPPPGHPARAR